MEEGRKRREEKLKKARQQVRWCKERRKWVAEFVTQAQLREDQPERQATAIWKDSCFDLACKDIGGFRAPVTKAEAFAAWLNVGYTWVDCASWWDHYHPVSYTHLRAHET